MRMFSGAVLRTQPDDKLAALAGEGSQAAFEAIVHRYRRMLLAYCRRLLLSDVRSEDVLQQTFLKAWEALRAGTQVKETKAWLYTIAHNQAISALRRPEFDFEQLNESLRGADAPDAELERRMLMRETLAAVAALPEPQREAILRTAVEGQSYEEAASALGISDGAVRGLVYRARAILRAGMAAVAPGPVVLWAAGGPRRSGGDAAQRVGEVIAGTGTGGAAVMLKGATVIVTSAVVVGGTVSGKLYRDLLHPQAAHAASQGHAQAAARPPGQVVAPAGRAGRAWTGSTTANGSGSVILQSARMVASVPASLPGVGVWAAPTTRGATSSTAASSPAGSGVPISGSASTSTGQPGTGAPGGAWGGGSGGAWGTGSGSPSDVGGTSSGTAGGSYGGSAGSGTQGGWGGRGSHQHHDRDGGQPGGSATLGAPPPGSGGGMPGTGNSGSGPAGPGGPGASASSAGSGGPAGPAVDGASAVGDSVPAAAPAVNSAPGISGRGSWPHSGY